MYTDDYNINNLKCCVLNVQFCNNIEQYFEFFSVSQLITGSAQEITYAYHENT